MIHKFRAWDKSEGQMTMAETLPKLMAQDGLPESWVEDMIFMQFTGLKDKNGVEPCIKDVVVLHLLQGAIPSVIEIHERWEVPVVNFFETWEPLYIYMGKDKDDTCVEVIGNIYESPELID